MHFVKSLSLKGMPAFGLIIMTDIYRLHCLFFNGRIELCHFLNAVLRLLHPGGRKHQYREGWHQGGLLYQGGVQERKPLALWLFGPNLVRPVVPVTLCEVDIYIRYRDFAYPKAFFICKGNNIFKILGNPRPTCLPGCGMPLGLGKAFLSPLILRLFWQQPIESLARKTAKITYALFNTLDNISLQ